MADFEIRGDVGIRDAGRSIADELLPAFRARYDLVERSQVGKVINELRLDLSTERGQEEYDRYMREYLGLE